MIRESCSCSASIECHDLYTVQDWRVSHKHDSDVEHWRFKYEQCNAESARRRERVNELKAELILLKRLGSGNPDTPPSAENPYNPCDCWRCDDSCQNSTENGTVVTANADNLEDDGERRQDEPPAGTPVWWQGGWWWSHSHPTGPFHCLTGDPYPGEYAPWWKDMPGAVAALTPDGVTREGKNGWLEGYKAGREDAAKEVEQVMATSFALKGGRSMDVISREAAVRAARGDKP